jgi:hypothetical protein
MSQENVELVRKGFEHFLATGEPAWDTLHEQVEVYDHDIMDGRDYRGHADVRRWLFEDWAAAWSSPKRTPSAGRWRTGNLANRSGVPMRSISARDYAPVARQ